LHVLYFCRGPWTPGANDKAYFGSLLWLNTELFHRRNDLFEGMFYVLAFQLNVTFNLVVEQSIVAFQTLYDLASVNFDLLAMKLPLID
jgi:hypothetical protein